MAQSGLAGRKVVITGGLGAVGRATAAVLVAQGARVALLVRQAPDADAALSGLPLIPNTDLTDEASTAQALSQAALMLGGIDGLVNVAGGFVWEKLEGGNISTWQRQFDVNLRTTVLASQQALPYLLKNPAAAIVNVGALATNKAALGMGAYTAAKSGVARLTEAMADEFKDRSLRINAVLPGTLDTVANRADMPDADTTRWVQPADLGAVIAFLLSHEARAVTGVCLPVNGRA
jgi:NAD(P)-dependent dehydrogenase (short-subunit alcohol dehydrogenase family)